MTSRRRLNSLSRSRWRSSGATESSNTSGLAFGGGYLWIAANGTALRRDPRPGDPETGRVIKIDDRTKGDPGSIPDPRRRWRARFDLGPGLAVGHHTVASKPDPGRCQLHNLHHSIPVTLNRAHGLAWDSDFIWCVFSNDYVIQRLAARDGRILEAVPIETRCTHIMESLSIARILAKVRCV